MAFNYENIKIPFLKNSILAENAEKFKEKFWDSSIPVDVEYIIDVKLKIDVIPSPGLYTQCNIDALIASSWQAIYIDKDKYLDERYQNRLRFSLAHEIGHFVLHKKIYGNFRIHSPRNFYDFLNEIPQEQYSYLETQANKFANYLLLPREKLIIEKNSILKRLITQAGIKTIDQKTLNSYLANPIAKIFGVSEQTAEIALNDTLEN